MTHGIGEHLGRHQYLNEVVGDQYNIFFYDLRGHGKSQGKSAWIDKFDQFYDDLFEIYQHVKDKHSDQQISLFGHSMGGLITAGFLQKYAEKVELEKVFLNAPPAGIPGGLGKVVDLITPSATNWLSSLDGGFYVGGMVNKKGLSHDMAVGEDYVSDSLNKMKLHSKLLLGLIDASKKVFSSSIPDQFTVFCSVGSKDPIVSVPALRNYFGTVEKKVELHEIDGAFHEIHNEVEVYRSKYFDYIRASLA